MPAIFSCSLSLSLSLSPSLPREGMDRPFGQWGTGQHFSLVLKFLSIKSKYAIYETKKFSIRIHAFDLSCLLVTNQMFT
jgi:hypothetical protein